MSTTDNISSGITSDNVGGNTGDVTNPSSTKTGDFSSGSVGGPSAGYENNVEREVGGTEKKGTMEKIKEKLLPDGPGKTHTEGHNVAHAAAHTKGEHSQGLPESGLNRE